MWGQVLYLLLGTKVHDTLLYLRYMTIIIVLDGARVLAHDAWAARIDFICPAHTLLQYILPTPYLLPIDYSEVLNVCRATSPPCPMPHAP